MTSFNLSDPDVLFKWWQTIYRFFPWAWKFLTRQEARACRRLLTRLDLLVDNIWPYLSSGSTREDSLRCVLEELFRKSSSEDQKMQLKVLDRYRDLGEWLSFLNIHLSHHLLVKPTRTGLLDTVVEMNAILGRIEKVMDDFGLTAPISLPSEEGRKKYLRFRDTYNRFLTDYEAFCREARAPFREIQEPSFKRLE